jgi:transposase-like protein
MTARPRLARRTDAKLTSLATQKAPLACPFCEGRKLVRKGTRQKKFECIQPWQCNHCGRVFTPAPAMMRGITFPPRIILEALTTYNLGHSLSVTAQRVHARYRYHVSASTWVAGFKTTEP